MSNENSAECVLRPRFDSLGGDPSRFNLLQGSICREGEQVERGAIHLGDVHLLRDALAQTKAKLVIVDPIQSYLGADVDAHRSNETRPILDGLARLAADCECTILLVRHLSKAPASRAIHRGLGSIDLTGAVRTEMIAGAAPDRPDQRAMVQIKNNLGPLGRSLGYVIEGEGLFRWTGESELTVSAILAAVNNKFFGAQAEEFLREVLREGPRPSAEILGAAEQAGVAKKTLYRAKDRLQIKVRKCGMKDGWEWSMSEGGQK